MISNKKHASYGELPTRNHLWVMFDLRNGNGHNKRYLWWFNTKREAVEFKREQQKGKFAATLSAPKKAMLKP